MTRKEKRAWEGKLTEIWGPVPSSVAVKMSPDEQGTQFSCALGDDAHLLFYINDSNFCYAILSLGDCSLYCTEGRCELVYRDPFASETDLESLTQFAHEWLPFFRRGCYLSGCKVECSAHEQLEWTKWLQVRKALDLEERLS